MPLPPRMVQGQIQRLNAELGQWVSRRDTITWIDDRVPLSQFLQAQAQVLAAQNSLEVAQLNFASDEELFASEDISQLAYRNSELAVRAAEAKKMAALAQLSALEKQFLDTRITPPARPRLR